MFSKISAFYSTVPIETPIFTRKKYISRWSEYLCKSMNWVLYHKDLRHEKVKVIRQHVLKYISDNYYRNVVEKFRKQPSRSFLQESLLQQWKLSSRSDKTFSEIFGISLKLALENLSLIPLSVITSGHFQQILRYF